MDTRLSFWDFSVETYGRNGVADALLSLQNGHGADVNMLLFCFWFGITRGSFSDQLFEEIHSFSCQWRENVVNPLRTARIWMKHSGCQSGSIELCSCMSFREKIKSIELQAEKLQQETLQSASTVQAVANLVPAEQRDAIAVNLLCYLDAAAIKSNENVVGLLDTVFMVMYPGQSIRQQLLHDTSG